MINHLQKIFGEDVSEQEIDKAAYSSDASLIEGQVQYVCLASNLGQVQALLIFANRMGADVVARGGGTGLAGGAVPNNSIVLDFSKMNRIIQIDVQNKTATVEPGVIVAELNRRLESDSLFFPVIPASFRVATVGGMIATNAAGTRAFKYGKMQENVLSLEFVDGTGKIYETGNAAELCGTEGTAGVVTKAILKLVDIPKIVTMSAYRFEEAGAMLDFIAKLERNNVSAIEFFCPLCSALLQDKIPRYNLLVEYESEIGGIKNKAEMLVQWQRRENVPSILGSNSYTRTDDPFIPREKMAEFLAFLHQKGIPVSGHIGIGVVHPRFKAEQSTLIEEMHAKVRELGGSFAGEHGIGTVKKELADENLKSRIKELKRRYDPGNTLNRGKML